jgi:DNA-binding transcriptional LysR family regulator
MHFCATIHIHSDMYAVGIAPLAANKSALAEPRFCSSGEEQMSFDLRLLKPFLAVSDTMSFTRAAESLGVAQSRVSMLVKRLETQLGFSLFRRGTRQIELTCEGAKVLEHARLLQVAVRDMEETVRATQSAQRHDLTVGSTGVFELPQRLRLIEAFNAERPFVRLRFTHERTPRLIAALRAREFDLTFATFPFDATELRTFCFAASDVSVAVPCEHPLAERRTLRIEDLRGHTVLVYPSYVGKQHFDFWFSALEKAGAILAEAPDNHVISLARFAASRRMLAIVHTWRGQTLPQDILESMVLQPIADGDYMGVRLMLVRRTGTLSHPAEAFWRLAEVIAEQGEAPPDPVAPAAQPG